MTTGVLPAGGPPGPDQVHVWLAHEDDLAADGRLTSDEPAFGPRRRFLRIVVGSYLGLREDQVTVDRSAGRPVIVECPSLGVSLSDSGKLIAVAITGSEAGVDLEDGTIVRRTDRLAPRVLTPTERTELDGVSDQHERHRALLRCWTRKEALLKALGRGLDLDPRTVDVGVGEHPRTPPVLAGNGLDGRRLVGLPLRAPNVGTVCVTLGTTVECRHLNRPTQLLSSVVAR